MALDECDDALLELEELSEELCDEVLEELYPELEEF